MRWRWRYGTHLAIVAACLAMAACAANGGTSSGGTSSGGTGTSSAGPVSILTDKAAYGPTDTIHVSVVNQLATSIWAWDTRASCSILDLQMQQASGQWGGTNVARCPLGRPAQAVEIKAGATYTTNIQAGYPGISSASFPAGTYQLVLVYYPNQPTSGGAGGTTITSATFQVSAAGGSGSPPPGPVSTAPPPA